MNKNPIWMLVFVLGFLGVFSLSMAIWLPLVQSNINLNVPFIIGFGLSGFIAITIYSVYRLNKDLKQDFTIMKDREKACDIIEDLSDLQQHLNQSAYLTERGIKKIQNLLSEEKNVKKN
jgi:nitrogen regulatory protein PII-like uncharacterized protein